MFPESTYIAQNQFLFLRFLCPAVVAPEAHGLLQPEQIGKESEDTDRYLVLIAKSMQNLANGVDFNAKAFHMKPLNPMLARNREGLVAFLNNFSNVPDDLEMAANNGAIAVDHIDYSYQFLHKYLVEKKSRIIEGMVEALDFERRSDDDTASETSEDSNEPLVGDAAKADYPLVQQFEQMLSALPAPRNELKRPNLVELSSRKAALLGDSEAEFVLNNAKTWKRRVDDPLEVSQRLLQQIVRLVDRYVTTNKRNPVDWKKLVAAPEFSLFENDICELQKCDMDQLTKKSMVAFVLNVHNILVLHLYTKVGAPTKIFERRAFFNAYKYHIGLGTNYTLDDLERGILRANYKAHFSADDPRIRFSFPLVDPRIHFALAHLNRTDPPTRSYSDATLDQDLDRATNEYFRSTIIINARLKRIVLPGVLNRKRTDFVGASTSNVDMLRWVLPRLTVVKRKALSQLLSTSLPSIKVTYSEVDWRTFCRFQTKLVFDGEVPTSMLLNTKQDAASTEGGAVCTLPYPFFTCVLLLTSLSLSFSLSSSPLSPGRPRVVLHQHELPLVRGVGTCAGRVGAAAAAGGRHCVPLDAGRGGGAGGAVARGGRVRVVQELPKVLLRAAGGGHGRAQVGPRQDRFLPQRLSCAAAAPAHCVRPAVAAQLHALFPSLHVPCGCGVLFADGH